MTASPKMGEAWHGRSLLTMNLSQSNGTPWEGKEKELFVGG